MSNHNSSFAPVAINECYYFLAQDNQRDWSHLFLLFALKNKDDKITFVKGISAKNSYNITCSNTLDGSIKKINLNGLDFAVWRFSFPSAEEKKEIVIHTYITEESLTYYKETKIPLDNQPRKVIDWIDPTNEPEGPEIAPNCPYVFLERDRFLNPQEPTKTTFFPRVIVPVKGFKLLQDAEVQDYDQDNNGNSFAVIIPLEKTDTQELSIIAPEVLNTNHTSFTDVGKIDVNLEVALILMSEFESIKLFQDLSFEDKLKIARKKGIQTGIQGITLASDPIINKPKSEDADIIPAAGIFIDLPQNP